MLRLMISCVYMDLNLARKPGLPGVTYLCSPGLKNMLGTASVASVFADPHGSSIVFRFPGLSPPTGDGRLTGHA